MRDQNQPHTEAPSRQDDVVSARPLQVANLTLPFSTARRQIRTGITVVCKNCSSWCKIDSLSLKYQTGIV
ncbi:MAG: hypothetical protein HKL95_02520 [Phycisphaerae bacterium]|nr:hypothetical protein [Phycisphaerae bacterium]